MTLKEYSEHFEKFRAQASLKKEVRTFEKYACMFNDLLQRDLGDEANRKIEAEIERLEIVKDSGASRKSYERNFLKITSFLRNEFSLVTEGYYTQFFMIMGMIMGQGIGMAIGASMNPGTGIAIGLSMGTGLGIAIGMALGAQKDEEARKQGRVIKTKLS